MWERFSYYGIRPLLVLFMTAALARRRVRLRPAHGVGDRRHLRGVSVYLASLPGGWIADRWLGLRRAIWYGRRAHRARPSLDRALVGVRAAAPFFLGLVLIVIGTGLLKPNISAIVGDLYPEGGARRDAGFSIFYMGINIGALIAPLITGFLGERVGWHWGFGAAGVGMLVGLLTFRLARRHDARSHRRIAVEHAGSSSARHATLSLVARRSIIALVVMLAMTGIVRIDPARRRAERCATSSWRWRVLVLRLSVPLRRTRWRREKRIAVILVLFVFSVDLLVRVRAGADVAQPVRARLHRPQPRRMGDAGGVVPVGRSRSFVILFAPVFAALWVGLARRGSDLSSPTKFALGLSFAGLGFSS